MRHPRSPVVNLLLALGSTLGTLLLLELGARMIRGIPLLSAENLIARRTAMVAIHRENRHDPLLGWVYRDRQVVAGAPPLTIGEQGVRMNGPAFRPLPRGAILACGDSFTVGEEVADGDTWPARLEALLGEPVVNAGVGGYGADQIILRAESLLPVLRPRTLIISFFMSEQLGDLGRAGLSTFAGANKPYFLIREGALVRGNDPVPPFSGRPGELGFLRSVLGRSALADWAANRLGAGAWWYTGPPAAHTGTDPARVVRLLLRRLKEQTDREGIRLLLLLQYGGGEAARWSREPELSREVLAAARADGIPAVNTWEPLRRVLAEHGLEGLRELYVMHEGGGVFGHLSPRGNEFTAHLLAAHLRGAPAGEAGMGERQPCSPRGAASPK